jgi:hypothetical protein
VRDELHVSFPLQPLEDAALAIGKNITEQLFWPLANGQIPPARRERLGGPARDMTFKDVCRFVSSRENYRDIRDDYHGGW